MLALRALMKGRIDDVIEGVGTVGALDHEELYAEGDRLYWAGAADRTLPLLERAANAGHVDSMFRLGRLHYDAGRKEPALRWFQSAAERGHVGAMIDLAALIESDDRDVAMAWTLKAVKEGHDLTAEYNYGVFLEEDGRLEEAERYYRSAAEVNFPATRNRLGCLLWNTDRGDQAERWFRRALDDLADSCDGPGDDDYEANTAIMCNLAGLLAETGRSDEALALYRQAAERGDLGAAEQASRFTS
ncbi:hypothetical protein GCM10010411_44680 [Actinomadura fulvescens]|uniref:Tetratricopeptide repeat protein n=2 Tax=Actinomadura fulvescens TaxID=46160 RepID=A0ABN3Q0F0_9ACTN